MADVMAAGEETARFSDDQVLLCLAGLAYRGFNDAAVGGLHTDAVRRAITQGLNTLSPLAGGWELVWGPVSYRAPLSLLDDGLMYVVRNRQAPHRYVVAIRGTNPVSAFDWVFGDLWAGRQARWPYGAGAARISLSTALGLAILKSLRSDGPRDDAREALWHAVDARMATIPGVARGALGWLTDLAQPAIAPLRYGVAKLLEALAGHRSMPHPARTPQFSRDTHECQPHHIFTCHVMCGSREEASEGPRYASRTLRYTPRRGVGAMRPWRFQRNTIEATRFGDAPVSSRMSLAANLAPNRS